MCHHNLTTKEKRHFYKTKKYKIRFKKLKIQNTITSKIEKPLMNGAKNIDLSDCLFCGQCNPMPNEEEGGWSRLCMGARIVNLRLICCFNPLPPFYSFVIGSASLFSFFTSIYLYFSLYRSYLFLCQILFFLFHFTICSLFIIFLVFFNVLHQLCFSQILLSPTLHCVSLSVHKTLFPRNSEVKLFLASNIESLFETKNGQEMHKSWIQ